MTSHSDGIYGAAETPTNGVVSAEQAAAARADAFWDITRLVETFDSLNDPPSLLDREDGQILLYAGRTNTIFGKPGTAKSFLALVVMHRAMQQGGRVLLADHEDRPTALYERTVGMGIEGQFMDVTAFRYLDHELFAEEQGDARMGAIEWLKGAKNPKYSLVVIDAAESAGCPSDGAPVTAWLRSHVHLWATEGLGVLLIDHLPKRKTIGDDVIGPIGSQAKLAAITGSALEVKGTAWTRNRDGQVSLVVHKDRGGCLPRRGQPAATVTGEHLQGRLVLRVLAPSADNVAAEGEDVERRILQVLQEAGADGVTGVKEVRSRVGLNATATDAARGRLVEAGLVESTKSGRTSVFTLSPKGEAHLLAPSDDEGEG